MGRGRVAKGLVNEVSNEQIISDSFYHWYFSFAISPYRHQWKCALKKIYLPLDHFIIWKKVQKSLHHFTTKSYLNIQTITTYHPFTISWFHHFTIFAQFFHIRHWTISSFRKNTKIIAPFNHQIILTYSNHPTISLFHHFTICAQFVYICHWTISSFGKKYKNHCTISPPNHIDVFKSSYHITISPYHDFTISLFVTGKTLLTVGPFHHLEKIQQSLYHFNTK